MSWVLHCNSKGESSLSSSGSSACESEHSSLHCHAVLNGHKAQHGGSHTALHGHDAVCIMASCPSWWQPGVGTTRNIQGSDTKPRLQMLKPVQSTAPLFIIIIINFTRAALCGIGALLYREVTKKTVCAPESSQSRRQAGHNRWMKHLSGFGERQSNKTKSV